MLLALLTLPGCLTQSLSPSWFIDRTRLLAVRSDPAEPRPGDLVTLSSLAVDPAQDLLIVWTGCVLESSSSYGCDTTDPEAISLLGVEPLLPPSLQVPADLLDDLPAEDRAEGKNYILTLSALAGDTDLSAIDELSEDDLLELGIKRLPVAEGATPNHNPDISHLLIDGELEVMPGGVLTVQRGQTYSIAPVLSPESVEEYSYINSDGVTETRTEEPYFTFYATDGDYPVNFSLYPLSAVDWTAPVDPLSDTLTIWSVVRDRRGGMGWFTLTVEVEG
ncbi:hypothetical protein L6R49_16565 [Myxococcota bacterium]|nr:hypothetical protein [Myxococcota bacterium]